MKSQDYEIFYLTVQYLTFDIYICLFFCSYQIPKNTAPIYTVFKVKNMQDYFLSVDISVCEDTVRSFQDIYNYGPNNKPYKQCRYRVVLSSVTSSFGNRQLMEEKGIQAGTTLKIWEWKQSSFLENGPPQDCFIGNCSDLGSFLQHQLSVF